MSTLENLVINPAGMMGTAEAPDPVTKADTEEDLTGNQQDSVLSDEDFSMSVIASAAEQTRQRRITLLALALCAAALWALASQRAQIARLNQSVSLLQSRVTAAQSANEFLYNEMYQVTSVPHILSLVERFHMKSAATVEVPLKP